MVPTTSFILGPSGDGINILNLKSNIIVKGTMQCRTHIFSSLGFMSDFL